MDWQAPGILLATRRHGEANAIIEAFTAAHGRHLGLVRGGGGRRLAPILQPGAHLALTWRARLSEHLGSFTVEPIRARAGALTDRLGLAGLTATTAMASFALPERQAFPDLYHDTETLLDAIDAAAPWPPHYVAWELTLLTTLGFGLDLETCGATGARDDLAYVSPRTGRAVARSAAGDWADRLLPLPPFLTKDAGDTRITAEHITQGLRLTGHFLTARLLPALGKEALPPARDRLLRAIAQH
ncbi:MAG: DNA repair protein RecO [Pseudomonadota bacterium]